jgi:hypothetical protein
VKREGPPQLQFLIATDPSQFRDEDAKRSVRSQAMIHWRHEEDKKKRKGSRKENAEVATEPSGHDSARLQHNQLRARLGSLSSDSDAGSSTWQLTASDTASYFPRYQKKIQSIAEKDAIDYEESERHEERLLRNLAVGLANFYNVGGSQDPFDVLPQFRNPRLDALYLSRHCRSSRMALRNTSDLCRYASIRF